MCVLREIQIPNLILQTIDKFTIQQQKFLRSENIENIRNDSFALSHLRNELERDLFLLLFLLSSITICRLYYSKRSLNRSTKIKRESIEFVIKLTIMDE